MLGEVEVSHSRLRVINIKYAFKRLFSFAQPFIGLTIHVK